MALFVDRGANIQAINGDGKTPHELAMDSNPIDEEILALLSGCTLEETSQKQDARNDYKSATTCYQ